MIRIRLKDILSPRFDVHRVKAGRPLTPGSPRLLALGGCPSARPLDSRLRGNDGWGGGNDGKGCGNGGGGGGNDGWGRVGMTDGEAGMTGGSCVNGGWGRLAMG